MEAASRHRTAAVQNLEGALAMLDPYRSASTSRRLATAYLTIESAKELLCDERQHRAVLAASPACAESAGARGDW